MSKFHSTISRRQFMKGLGLAGAGLGAAAAAAPVFRDLDEVISSTADVGQPWPWYVSKRDPFDPTSQVDWSVIKPYDTDERATWPYERPDRPEPEVFENKALEIDPDLNWKDPRRQAMQSGSRASFSRNHDYGSWLGNLDSTTPGDRYPKWTGSEEENLKLLTGAARFFGSQGVGALERDEHLMKLIFKKNGRTSYVFDSSISLAEERDLGDRQTERAIPTTYNWAFTWILRQPMDATTRQIGGGGRSDRNPLRIAENFAMAISYNRIDVIEDRIQKFLRGLGYHGVGGGMRGNCVGNAVAILSGWGEHGRMGMPMIFPRWGVTPRGTYRMITDFPLAPGQPIDFGAYEFCKTCEICSDWCPAGCIQKGEPTWEGNPPGNPNQMTGFLGWRTHAQLCPHCPICHRMCPFNSLETDGSSFMHNLVSGTIATTSLFNSFFTSMEKTFDYSMKTEGDYWDVFDKHPVWGWDSRT